jgi:GTPase Era involved in 16S rRNA processing
VFYISALTGYGMDDLKEYLYERSVESEWLYPDNVKTTHHPIE